MKCLSPTLNVSSVIWHFKINNVIEIRDGITFDFYTGLPHMLHLSFLSSFKLTQSIKLYANLTYTSHMACTYCVKLQHQGYTERRMTDNIYTVWREFSRGPIFTERRSSKISLSNFHGWPFQNCSVHSTWLTLPLIACAHGLNPAKMFVKDWL